jgi:CheY-like chemotaxis protein
MSFSPLGGGLVARAHQLGLVSLAEVEECWAGLGTRNVSEEEMIRVLERKGILTEFHVQKLRKGETTGFFYGRYKILYKIASGSFARVYRAVDRTTGETAAVKVLRNRWSNDPACVAAFRHEAEVGLMLRHPNIVRVDEAGVADGHHYIGMEFVEGGNMREFLRIRGRLSPEEAKPLMLDMLKGLSYAFSVGVTHRDLKLTNVLISSKGVAKLVDFGLATFHESEQKAEEAHGQRTVEYARLERMTNAPPNDPRSDIFFLGCIFYQMIAGVPPIPEKRDRAARLLRTRLDNIPPVLVAYPQADPSLAAIIDRMMSLDLNYRYQTPDDVMADLLALGPIERPEPGGAVIQAAAQPAASTGAAQDAKPTILWLENDPRLQQAVRDRLQELGYRVLVTASPERALRRFRETEIHAVLVDCETEGRAGFDAVTEMLRLGQLSRRPVKAVVLLTAEQRDWSRELPADSGHVRVITKPASFKDLKAALLQLLPLPSPQSA